MITIIFAIIWAITEYDILESIKWVLCWIILDILNISIVYLIIT